MDGPLKDEYGLVIGLKHCKEVSEKFQHSVPEGELPRTIEFTHKFCLSHLPLR